MPQPKILIIDDSESILDLIKMILGGSYQFEVAMDGEAGLRMARETKPDLIILDIMLPKFDGFTVCRLLKFDEKYKHIPIILLTARGTAEDRAKGKEAGADVYINKPFDKDELKRIVADMLKPSAE